ncbi:MAG TPA: ABC transporter permease [Thermoanaerobaculia bacterium]|nr:ABC transporter permease [Thermoanaerobaculia bacterium]
MTALARQLRLTLRSLRRAPLFTTVTVLTLAVGIGATSAVFSVVHGVLIAPLPYDEPERLVQLAYQAPGLGPEPINQSPALYFTFRDESELMVDSGMWGYERVSVTERTEPEQVEAIRVTDGVFGLLGVEAAIGRTFSVEDDAPGSPETVVLSDGYWRQRLGADRSIVGETLIVDGVGHRVIGVLPPDLRFLDEAPALYLPFQWDRSEVFVGNFSYPALARLRPGVTLEQANAEVGRMIEVGFDTFPMPAGFSRQMIEDVGFAPEVSPLSEAVVGDVGNVLWLLLGTVGIVLLIACANVANLLLVRAEGRHQELAIRSALGAGRRRLGGELMLESLLLGLAGGIAGLALAAAGLRLLHAAAPRGLPRLDEIAISPEVLLFTLATSFVAAVGFGLFPLARVAGGRLAEALKAGGRGSSDGRRRQRVRGLLVASQVALALVLLVGSGLMIRSFQALRSADPGFRDAGEVLTLTLSVPEAEVEDFEAATRLHERLLAEIQALPGVEQAGLTSSVTMDGRQSNDPIFVEDFPLPETTIPPLRRFKWVSPEYFETMGNPLVAGRGLTWADVQTRAEVAVVTENLAREYWRDPAEAVGRRIRPYPQSPWRTIVGVVGDVRDGGIEQPATPVVYWPLVVRDFFVPGELEGRRTLAYAIRSPRVGTTGFLNEVRETIWSVAPNLPLADVRTLEERLDRSMARTSFTLVMLAIAALAALLLGAVGIYGVTSYAVSQRRRELGVRLALGARPADVLRLVLRHGLLLALAGAGAGLVAAVAATRLMSAVLHGVSALDPIAFAAAALAVVALALAASWLPARRAAGIDPIETLRWQ